MPPSTPRKPTADTAATDAAAAPPDVATSPAPAAPPTSADDVDARTERAPGEDPAIAAAIASYKRNEQRRSALRPVTTNQES
ncbi:hypothetical protein SK069_05770 [Patulibacter brassicae]|uniref:Uncharacterized protein n=1 Tax=Patulibacter brassicae TaxID=1705717 RepID=A0ABU4VGZ0_9ACTN|nr:hypothetical protein [Patulibacter brassicae]MDX8151092.1 hypothetical protein [Patulibacter brassicae]